MLVFVRARGLLAMVGAGCSALAVAGTDLVVAQMNSATHWTGTGAVSGRRAYSFNINTCNVGDAPASWNGNNEEHPVFAQNLHMIAGGRIRQIGLGFAWHGFSALEQAFCSPCSPTQDPTRLGAGCSSADTSSILGQQGLLGPRSAVNPSTGALVWPMPATQCSGAICERVSALESDLLDAGAIYVAETVLVQFEDAASSASDNNATWRQMLINGVSLNATPTGPTVVGSAVEAWRALGAGGSLDPRIHTAPVDVDGRFVVGGTARALGGGVWQYDLVIENISSDRAGGGVTIPAPISVSPASPEFTGIEHHSGEVYSNDPWTASVEADSVRFASPETFAQNPNTNALRWGTLYRFSFTAEAPPTVGSATLSLFKPGAEGSVSIPAIVPTACEGDADGDSHIGFADLNAILDRFGEAGSFLLGDLNADGVVDFVDLNLLLGAYGQSC